MEDPSDCTSNYCFGCLCDSNEKEINSYTFVCGTLKELFRTSSMHLCCMCKRMAQHTELFIQNVQSNQILLENYCSAIDDSLKSVRLQIQPLVNLQQISSDVIELCDSGGCSDEEVFTVLTRSDEVKVKAEMKEEAEVLDNIEAEFINGDDEFPEMYVKEEDDFPLKELLKEEIEAGSIANMDLMNLSSTTKKKVKKKISKIKREDINKTRRTDVPRIKTIYQTRKQCMEERVRLAQDHKYLACTYKCTDCIKGFTFKESYDKHMEKHNQSRGQLQCDICRQRLHSEEKLGSHMRYHLVRYSCGECGLTRNCRMTIKEHYAAQHLGPDHHFTCTLCNKTFRRELNLRKHVRYSHGARERVRCAHCARLYASSSVLKAHVMLKHAAEASSAEAARRWACADCGAQFRSAAQLRSHAGKHSAARDHYCVECDKSFKSESILKTHLKTASVHVNYKELPLSCSHCDKRFSNRRDVERHTNRVHLNVKPFTCDKCDKAYVNAWALKEHKRYIHEGYRRPLQFACPMCDKVFDRKQVLTSHIRTHTGERPYACAQCAAHFAQPSVLRTHTRLVHLKFTRDGRPKPPHKH